MTTYYNYLGQAMAVSADPTTWVNGNSSGGQTLVAPTGPSAVNVNGGNGDTLIASQGDNIFYVNNMTDVVQAAAGLSGIKTIVSYGGGYELPANVQNLTFYGQWDWGVGNSLDNLIIMGGNDKNTMDGGGGNDVLVGGFGENDFQFEVGALGGHDVYYNFHPYQDTVRLAGANYTSFAQIQSHMQQVGSDVVLTIDANDSITFRDMTIAALQPQNFLLPLDRSQLGAMTFDDEFTSLQLYNPSTGQGHWQTNFGDDPTKLDNYAITSNDEKQLYTAPNFKGQGGWDLSAYNPFSIESGGVLDITAGKFSYADSQHTWGQAYYSGMLSTRGVFMQKYGYFEMRAQLPTGLGSWPALWMAQDPYKPGVEADILEHLAMYPNVNFIRADDAGNVIGHTTYMPALSGFHTYGMLWGTQTTTFYIDDMAVMSLPTPASWDQPMYMILDLAMGGWGGAIDESALPEQMKVDWVHVYGLASAPPSGGTNPSPPSGSGPTPPSGPGPAPPSTPQSAPADYNGDGASEIAFRNPTTGAWGFMAAGAAGGQTWHDVGPTSTDYAVLGFGDFNDDGLADVAFRQKATGDWGFMTASPSGGETWHAVGPTSLDYSVIATGDFNGDGLADIAFRQTATGHWGFMTANPSGGETWHDIGPTSMDYAALGAGDFDGDGRADIAFRNNATGDLGFMSANASGGETWHAVGPTSPDYAAIGIGDFNGDHVLDVAFRQKATGDWGYMSVLPSGGEAWHAVGPTSTAYDAIATGDFNHDGLTDIAFRNMATGDLGFMSVNLAGGELWHSMGPTSTDYFSV
jgi:beta-glucanase (GH16 family)